MRCTQPGLSPSFPLEITNAIFNLHQLFMIYKKFPFLSLAFVLSSLYAVTAISLPKGIDGGQLVNRRDDQDFTIAFMNLTDVGGM